MRFDREPRPQGYCWTPRKEAMYLRREARDAEKIARDYPLFVGQFEPRPTLPVAEERARRERQLYESEQRWRDLKASQWRRARREYFACPPAMREAIAEAWRRWPGPARPVYFTYVIEKHNGVIEEKSRQHREREAAMLARIRARETAQSSLLIG
jgi:hypothetical protein